MLTFTALYQSALVKDTCINQVTIRELQVRALINISMIHVCLSVKTKRTFCTNVTTCMICRDFFFYMNLQKK